MNNSQVGIQILVVEDIESTAEAIKSTLEERLSLAPGDVRIINDFDEALNAIQPSLSCEVIVLDLYVGEASQSDDKKGQQVWEKIWDKKLMPVIIHTGGECDLDPPIPKNNPFVTCISKGNTSDEQVADYIASLRPQILALREVAEEFNKAIHSVLKHTSPLVWQVTENDEQLRSQVLVRSARRRLAATMDLNTMSGDQKLMSWEQYVYPPLGDSLLMGDVLRVSNGSSEIPEDYRLVLTPSCDTQLTGSGKCKVESVLVSKCTHIKAYFEICKVKMGKVAEELPPRLREPQQGGFIPLPAYEKRIPLMAADLRKLELIPLEDISAYGRAKMKYERIASIDSPFREYLSWAHMNVAGRPGMPERDFIKWAEEIKDEVQKEQAKEKTAVDATKAGSEQTEPVKEALKTES
jgi:CheY-like chemotaxis protein